MADLKDEIATILQTKRTNDDKQAEKQDQDRATIEIFFKTTVAPAFAELGDALRANGRAVDIHVSGKSASFVVRHEGVVELDFRLESEANLYGLVTPVVTFTDRSDGKRYRAHGYIETGSQNHGGSVTGITKDVLVRHVMQEYRRTITGR